MVSKVHDLHLLAPFVNHTVKSPKIEEIKFSIPCAFGDLSPSSMVLGGDITHPE